MLQAELTEDRMQVGVCGTGYLSISISISISIRMASAASHRGLHSAQ